MTKYSTSFVWCPNEVIKKPFTRRADLDHAIMKQIVPTMSKHCGDSDEEKLPFRRWKPWTDPGSHLRVGGYLLKPQTGRFLKNEYINKSVIFDSNVFSLKWWRCYSGWFRASLWPFLYNCFLFTKLHHQRHNNADLLNLEGKSHAYETRCKYQHRTTRRSTLVHSENTQKMLCSTFSHARSSVLSSSVIIIERWQLCTYSLYVHIVIWNNVKQTNRSLSMITVTVIIQKPPPSSAHKNQHILIKMCLANSVAFMYFKFSNSEEVERERKKGEKKQLQR